MVTGSYNKSGHVIDISGTNNTALPTNFDMKRGKIMGTTKKYIANKKLLPDSS